MKNNATQSVEKRNSYGPDNTPGTQVLHFHMPVGVALGRASAGLRRAEARARRPTRRAADRSLPI